MVAPRFDRPFVAVFPDQVRALGSIESAAVLQFIAYAQGADESVVLETAAIADGTGLSLRTVQRVAARLREQGHLTSERSSSWCSTPRWTVAVRAGQVESDKVAVSGPPERRVGTAKVAVSQTAKLAVPPSVSEVEELPPTSPPTDEQATLPLLTVVPTVDVGPDLAAEFDRFWALWPSGRKVGKPKAEQAYRAARKRGAAVETIAAGLHAHLPAWTARIAAGESGFVPHPTTWLNRDGWDDEPPRQAPRARSNVFADPALGGPDAATMERFTTMMSNDRPRAIGGGS